MTWENVIVLMLFMLIAQLLFRYMDKRRNVQVKAENGVSELKMNPIYALFGAFCLGFGFLMFFTAIGNAYEESAWVVLVLATSFLLFGAYVMSFGRRHRVKYSEEGLEIKNWRGKIWTFTYEQIQSVQYVRTKGVFQFRTEDEMANCHFHLKGITPFLQYVQHKSNLEVQF
jgi:hypothetical protein